MLKTLSTAALLGLLATGAVQAQATDCGNAGNTVEINACMAEVFGKADAALNVAYQEVLAHIRDYLSYDAALAAKAEDDLRNAQRAWITLRDSDCAVAGHSVSGGSMQSMVMSDCMIVTTQNRTDALYALQYYYRP